MCTIPTKPSSSQRINTGRTIDGVNVVDASNRSSSVATATPSIVVLRRPSITVHGGATQRGTTIVDRNPVKDKTTISNQLNDKTKQIHQAIAYIDGNVTTPIASLCIITSSSGDNDYDNNDIATTSPRLNERQRSTTISELSSGAKGHQQARSSPILHGDQQPKAIQSAEAASSQLITIHHQQVVFDRRRDPPNHIIIANTTNAGGDNNNNNKKSLDCDDDGDDAMAADDISQREHQQQPRSAEQRPTTTSQQRSRTSANCQNGMFTQC